MTLTQAEITRSALTAAVIVKGRPDDVLLDWLVQLQTEVQRARFTQSLREQMAQAINKPTAEISTELMEDVVKRILSTLESKFPRSP